MTPSDTPADDFYENPDPVAEAKRLLEAATPGPWLGVIKPNGKGTGLVGVAAKRGMGEQGCLAVINSIPGGAERKANTELIAAAPRLLTALVEEVERLRAALTDCGTEAAPSVLPDSETETYCYGNLIHVGRIVAAAPGASHGETA